MLQILDEQKQTIQKVENLVDVNNTFYLLIKALKEGSFSLEADYVSKAYKHFSDKLKDLLEKFDKKE